MVFNQVGYDWRGARGEVNVINKIQIEPGEMLD
jgi:hypothetical protein